MAKKRRQGYLALFITVSLIIVALIVWKMLYAQPPCANSQSCIDDMTGTYQPGKASVFMGKLVIPPSDQEEDFRLKPVLGTETGGEKHIYVDLSTQKLSAYEGEKLIFSFPVATGKWYPTPTGDFRIWVKLRYTRMSGGNPADGTYYNLYNVPYTMFFSNDKITRDRGFALHGAYWHNNFGYPMSHGCVNMRPVDAKKIYDWANPPTTASTTYANANNQGTLITVYGMTPVEN